ncbi:3'-5' exonuclease domain-containing protein 2 [Dechloromonas sp. XY25]|uniref:3'-5' exonuclease domain-containing protein 2 n=1 Tax=Dechloromonas hankyongensis TaxID=2908002 RepID=A0ABS9K3T9_9RHOO|nr:3'-5' exonuclease [Dechloromonas hankyongensis]MCG2577806.1 3'-5' exonuclease domain-containing protein 2 [Dechloromonas hankyongensis]
MSDVTFNRRQIADSELPVFQGVSLADIILVDSVDKVAAAQATLLASPVLGFDTESKPTFRKGEVSTGPHLVQLATDERVYLFPVSFEANHAALRQILAARNVIKAGFGLGNDRSALRSRLDIELNNVLDLGEVLRGPGHRGTVGAKVAVAHYFSEKLIKSKRVGTSNWASRRLDERQMLYAANDAHVALRIYHAWLQDSSRQARPAAIVSPPQEKP